MPRPRLGRRCLVAGCDHPRHGHGYCRRHYRHWKRHGDPVIPRPTPARPARPAAPPRLCSLDDCDQPREGHGYCKGHSRRWRLYGDPRGRYVRPPSPPKPPPTPKPPKPRRTLGEVLAANTVRRGGCLIWTGSRNHGGTGHGMVCVNNRSEAVHRAVWRQLHGDPVPPKLYRTCSSPVCVEPDHLTTHRTHKRWSDGFLVGQGHR